MGVTLKLLQAFKWQHNLDLNFAIKKAGELVMVNIFAMQYVFSG